MPRPNNRSFKSNSGSGSGYSKSGYSKGGRKSSRSNLGSFNMLNFGQAFLDETDGKATFKARLMFKTKDGEHVNVTDEQGNEYTPEEAIQLLAKALLDPNKKRAVNVYFFEQEDGSWGGNARIDISGLEEETEDEEPAPKKSAKAKTKVTSVKAQPKFEVPDEEDDSDDDIEDADDDEELPY